MQGVTYTTEQLHRFCWVAQQAQERGESIASALSREAGVSPASAVKLAQRIRKRGFPMPYDRADLRDDDGPKLPEVTLTEFVALVQPETWQRDAACRGVDPELFFPGSGGRSNDARKVCASCPVSEQCLDYALRMNEKVGIWGGTSWAERRTMKRPKVSAA